MSNMHTLADLNNRNPPSPPNNPGYNQPPPNGQGFAAPNWKDVPMGFYMLSLTSALVWFLSFFFHLPLYLANIPVYTVFKLQVWRILTSFLSVNDIFSLLFTLIMCFFVCMSEESDIGTARFLLRVLFRNAAIQVVTTVAGLLLALVVGLPVFSLGVWPVFFLLISLRMLADPDNYSTLCCFPCPI